MLSFLVTAIRICAVIFLQSVFWTFVHLAFASGRQWPPLFVWAGALALFALCYVLQPRILWLEEARAWFGRSFGRSDLAHRPS